MDLRKTGTRQGRDKGCWSHIKAGMKNNWEFSHASSISYLESLGSLASGWSSGEVLDGKTMLDVTEQPIKKFKYFPTL